MLSLLLLLLLLQFTFAVSLFLSRRTKQSVCCKKRCAHSFSMIIVVVVAALLLLLFFRAMHVEYIAQIIMFAVAIFFAAFFCTYTHACICTCIYLCGFFCRLFCCLRRFVSLKNTRSRCMCAHIHVYNKQTQSNTMKIFAPPLHFCMQQQYAYLAGLFLLCWVKLHV